MYATDYEGAWFYGEDRKSNVNDSVLHAERDVVLEQPVLPPDNIDFDALSASLVGLEGKLDKKPKTAAVILAGGTGDRFGREGGKQLVEIAGKPVLTRRSTRWGISGSSSSCAPKSAMRNT